MTPLDKSLSSGVDRESFSSTIVDTPVDKSRKAAEDNCEPPRGFISPIDIVEEATQINTHETAEALNGLIDRADARTNAKAHHFAGLVAKYSAAKYLDHLLS